MAWYIGCGFYLAEGFVMMTFDQALDVLTRDDRFKATISAMNALLIQKGVYTQREFEIYFCQWAESECRKSPAVRQQQSVNHRLETA
jgi:hypothetical protein